MKLSNILDTVPSPISDILISIYNTMQYRNRMKGKYNDFLLEIDSLKKLSYEDTYKFQRKEFEKFINHIKSNSEYYKEVLSNIEIDGIHDLNKIPILDKKILIDNLSKISTINEDEGYVSYTGGTTGSSMKVIYSDEDIQKRFAILDSFRSDFGYRLGKKTIWLSGKSFVTKLDRKNNRFYKDDYINKVRFLSTFDINSDTIESYIKSIIKFKPEFIVGFPSSLYLICKYAKAKGYDFICKVKYFFPTAETLTSEHRELISIMFGCEIKNQYASSEGAPFIIECSNGKLHMDITSGIFEVIDSDGVDSYYGELLVTSFSTYGTPLLRYKIGDNIELDRSGMKCQCGLCWPIVRKIDGRKDDFLLSSSNSRINLGNISNCTKDVDGIICFQIEQNCLSCLEIKLVTNELFCIKNRIKFLANLHSRFGNNMKINFTEVDDIPLEKSGKFRLVKNNIK